MWTTCHRGKVRDIDIVDRGSNQIAEGPHFERIPGGSLADVRRGPKREDRSEHAHAIDRKRRGETPAPGRLLQGTFGGVAGCVPQAPDELQQQRAGEHEPGQIRVGEHAQQRGVAKHAPRLQGTAPDVEQGEEEHQPVHTAHHRVLEADEVAEEEHQLFHPAER